MKLTYLYVYFHKNFRFGCCGFTVTLLCDPIVHQCCKHGMVTNKHFYHCTVYQRESKRGRISDGWILSWRIAATREWGMGIVSKTITGGKEGKQIAHFEISDPNRPIISMRALPLCKQSSIFLQVCQCCFREPRLPW